MRKRIKVGILNDHLNNNQGATSVLIILLLVVLMIFGLTILTTTLSNESLSNKKNEWLTDYYTLEKEVALNLAEIDHQIQALKLDALSNGSENRDQYLIDQLKSSIDGMTKENNKHYFWLDISESSGEYLKYITVKAEILIPDNSVDKDTFLKTKNYEIVLYSESQDLFEYNDIEYGVPFAPDKD